MGNRVRPCLLAHTVSATLHCLSTTGSFSFACPAVGRKPNGGAAPCSRHGRQNYGAPAKPIPIAPQMQIPPYISLGAVGYISPVYARSCRAVESRSLLRFNADVYMDVKGSCMGMCWDT